MGKKTNLKSWLVMAVILVGMAPAIAAGGSFFLFLDKLSHKKIGFCCERT